VGGLLVASAGLAVVAAVLAHRAEPFLRARIVQALSDRFQARVELDSFHLSLGNGLRGQWGVWAEGRGLRIWLPANHPGGEELSSGTPAQVAGIDRPPTAQPVEPLIRLDEFRFHAPLRYQPGAPLHVSDVQLKGLAVDLPPRSHFLRMLATAGGRVGAPHPHGAGPLVGFRVDAIECTGAHLTLETSTPGKLPLQIAIAHFKLDDVTANGAMHFDAELTNPRPVGTIHTTGSFGPWQGPDPGESPIAGDYRFDHADLASFKGIAGILSSTGRYQGTLRDITVDGQTDTPDFRLSHFGNALALHTRFHARVDGTNGDTWLDPVEATLGHSHLTVRGQIVRVLAAEADGPPHSVGHDIALAVSVDRGRIEDFLRLASHESTPLLTGDVTVKATLHIPPGPAPVHERMTMNGSFALDQVQFTSAKIQDRIRELSLRGQGRLDDLKAANPGRIESRMGGDFKIAGGVITLPNLDYTVPGADIQLQGTYGIESGALSFAGTARMQATISQMVGGWKGLLLKPADRFFRKNGAGAQIPLHIRGTRQSPDFGIDFNRIKAN
jgi:hypothetical protein